MKKLAAVFAAIGVITLCCSAYALYDVCDTGIWPDSWPEEMESLREQSRTLIGPTIEQRHFAIRFQNREEFEESWPHILQVKSEGAPVFLMRGENFFLGDDNKAGVIVHCPPEGQRENPATPEAPIPHADNPRVRWMNTNYIELVVDGDIVDLNRIQLPADTPIYDERFENGDND
jgi:hypothetical protein